MKFIIKKDILIKALSDTGKVFSMGKVAVPILNNFKFTVEKDFIEILASNGDTTILNKLDVFDDDGYLMMMAMKLFQLKAMVNF